MTALLRTFLLAVCFCVLSMPVQAGQEVDLSDMPKLPKLSAENVPQLRELYYYADELPVKFYDEAEPLAHENDAKGLYGLMMRYVEQGDPDAAYGMGRLYLDGVHVEEDRIEAAAWLMVGYKLSPTLRVQANGRNDLKKIVQLFSPEDRLAKTGQVKDRAAEIVAAYYKTTTPPAAHIDKPETYDQLFSGGDEPGETQKPEKPEPKISRDHVMQWSTNMLEAVLTFDTGDIERHIAVFRERNPEAWADLDQDLVYGLDLDDANAHTHISIEPLVRPVLVSYGVFDGNFRFVWEHRVIVHYTGDDGVAVKDSRDLLATMVMHCADDDPACEKLVMEDVIFRGSYGDELPEIMTDARAAEALARKVTMATYNVDLRVYETAINAIHPHFTDDAWADYAVGMRPYYKVQPEGAMLEGTIPHTPPYLSSIGYKKPMEFRFTYQVDLSARDPFVAGTSHELPTQVAHVETTCTSEATPCPEWKITQFIALDKRAKMIEREY